MIVKRFEKGQKFLDLHRWFHREIAEDGLMYEKEIWEVVIWENDKNPNEHTSIRFSCDIMANLFITQNQWKEQEKWQ